MNIDRLFRPFSTRSIILLLVELSFILQIIIIAHNHYTGYHIVEKLHFAIIGVIIGTIISSIAGIIVSILNLAVIRFLNSHFSWTERFLKRIFFQVVLTILIGSTISAVTTLVYNFFNPYSEDFGGVMLSNILIVSVVNILLMTILEGWIFFNESTHEKQKTGGLKYELSQVKFDILKSQINPHFMFNSLNVLSILIKKDVPKAQKFIEDFSIVYRYVAETIEKPLVTLGRELDFIESYLYLQKIRHGEQLTFSTKISGDLLEFMLPPLSLQVIIENAIKHNIINETTSFCIEIFSHNTTLIIKNKLTPKVSADSTVGIGLKNLTKRYGFVCNKYPEFKKANGYFIAKLPLIKT